MGKRKSSLRVVAGAQAVKLTWQMATMAFLILGIFSKYKIKKMGESAFDTEGTRTQLAFEAFAENLAEKKRQERQREQHASRPIPLRARSALVFRRRLVRLAKGRTERERAKGPWATWYRE